MHTRQPEKRAQQVLSLLQDQGFVTTHANRTGSFAVWTLDKRGFEVAKLVYGSELKENGWRSESLEHDLLVQRVHLGEFVYGPLPSSVDLLTEQELRRLPEYEITRRLGFVPDHRPDGFFIFNTADSRRIIALEIERSGKNPDLLKSVYQFYDNSRKLTGCIWVMNGSALFRSHKRAENIVAPTIGIHHYVYEDDFEKLGWDTEIFGSPLAGQKLREFLFQGQSGFCAVDARQVCGQCRAEALRDLSRSGRIFKKFLENSKLQNPCMYMHTHSESSQQTPSMYRKESK